MSEETVLVTGGTGFIAQHCILALLDAGYRVRTTVRSLAREAQVRAHLKIGGAEPGDRLSFAVADLGSDAGWDEASAGCRFAFHGASPTPSGDQVREEDWVKPAVDGNLRVLRAARAAGLKRVVLTSAFGAIGAGHPAIRRPFVETDWSDPSGAIAPYQKSKTLAELASWEFIKREGSGLELASVNPTMVLGPALGSDISHSIRSILNMLNGQPAQPRIKTCLVDVRDVADLHLRAMTNPAANGERFLATTGGSLWMVEIARLLKERLGTSASKVSTRELPNLVVRAMALFSPALRGIVPLLDVDLAASGEKAQRLLGWTPRSREDAIVATAQSLVDLGMVKQ